MNPLPVYFISHPIVHFYLSLFLPIYVEEKNHLSILLHEIDGKTGL